MANQINKIPCLYCQTDNDEQLVQCSNCGMPLTKTHPLDRKKGLRFFVKAFWGIVIFCIFMMLFLPR